MVYFTDNRGRLAGRGEARERVRLALARWSSVFSLSTRKAVMRDTVENDEWLGARNGMLLQAIGRDAVDLLWHSTAYPLSDEGKTN